MDWLLIVSGRLSCLIQYLLSGHFRQIADLRVVSADWLIVANFIFKNLLVDLPNYILR